MRLFDARNRVSEDHPRLGLEVMKVSHREHRTRNRSRDRRVRRVGEMNFAIDKIIMHLRAENLIRSATPSHRKYLAATVGDRLHGESLAIRARQ